jgi:stress response protein YsnF/sporulation protein YlmC with PRC-barrel domain
MTNSFNDRSDMNTLVEKLRQRLKNFAVVDRQGERLGEVKDIILDTNSQLNLVVMRLGNNLNPQQFLLISKRIKKIEPANKTVLVDIDSEMTNFPEYRAPETPDEALAENLNNSQPDTSGDSDRIDVTSTANEDLDLQSTPVFETNNMQNEVQSGINLEPSQQQVVLDEDIIRLLEERVVVERGKRKIGEVIVRKEVGTRMVQVPVRYEKLIIEEVGSEPRQLAEIDLSLAPVSQDDLPDTAVTATKTISSDKQSATAITEDKNTSLNGDLTVSGKFSSPKIASLILNAIAMERRHGCKQIRVEIVVEDEERKKTYQEWFARTSKQ